MPIPRPLETSTARPKSLFVVGAKKCGTTSLHHLLRQHPQIAVCDAKEPEFFSHPNNLDTGFASYLEGFGADLERGRTTILDCSVAYSQYPYRLDSSLLIHGFFPDARIVYMVRDPVERWISDYLHESRKVIGVTPEVALSSEPRLLATSRFGDQISRYIDVFGSEQVLVVRLETLAHEPNEVAQRVFAHAGLPSFEVIAPDGHRTNPGGIDHYIRHRTTSRIFSFPGGDSIRAVLPDSLKRRAFDFVRSSRIGRRIEESRPTPVFTDALRKKVGAALADDIERFRQLTGVDFRDAGAPQDEVSLGESGP